MLIQFPFVAKRVFSIVQVFNLAKAFIKNLKKSPYSLEAECKCRPKTCQFCKQQVSLNKNEGNIVFFKFAFYGHRDIFSKINVHFTGVKRQLMTTLGDSHIPGVLEWKCAAGTMQKHNLATFLEDTYP